VSVDQVQEEEGIMLNSGFLDGLDIDKAINKMMDYLEDKGWGKRMTNYHLRDWLISRQRYWGAPIPMIYCDKCANEGKRQEVKGKRILQKDQSDWDPSGWYAEENLPVVLPDITDFKPEGEGRGPLANHPEFYKTTCPHCGSEAKRETDVMDTFVDSSWYFLRYPSVDSDSNSKLPFDPVITKKWLPVDLYFGGAEHSVLHLMYARFVTMALRDLGYIDFQEPFPRFYAHGLMIKDGAKMSKSRGNVVNPDEYIEKFGADTLRLYLMFMGPMDGFPDFRDTGIEGMRRFVGKVWGLFSISNIPTNAKATTGKQYQISNMQLPISDKKQLQIKMHQTIKKVTEDIQLFKFNTAISAIMEYVNLLREAAVKAKRSKLKGQRQERGNSTDVVLNEALKNLALLLAPFAPHIAEEVWVNRLNQKFSIHKADWPKFNPDFVREEEVTVAIQVNGKLRATIVLDSGDSKQKDTVLSLAKSNEKISVWLKDKEIQKEVFVPGKILNIVTKE
jgi:leucyl-tRNA synthetase